LDHGVEGPLNHKQYCMHMEDVTETSNYDTITHKATITCVLNYTYNYT